ncbi:MAG: hypothetical protein AABZ39_04305 [Spirochaetota bacterium]
MRSKARYTSDETAPITCSIQVSADMKERIVLEAAANRRSFDWVVNEALKDYMNPKDRRRKKRHPALR